MLVPPADPPCLCDMAIFSQDDFSLTGRELQEVHGVLVDATTGSRRMFVVCSPQIIFQRLPLFRRGLGVRGFAFDA